SGCAGRHSICSMIAPGVLTTVDSGMGHNTLPPDFNDLLALGRQIASGLDLHGAEPGITEMSTSELQRNLEGAQKADIAWSAARSAKVSSETRLAAANEALAAWLTKARLVVMLARGEKWSRRWIETGFTHRAANVSKR